MATSATRRIYQINIENPEKLNNMQIGFCTSTPDLTSERQDHWCGKDADGVVHYFTHEYEPAILESLSFSNYDRTTSAASVKGVQIGNNAAFMTSAADLIDLLPSQTVIGNDALYSTYGDGPDGDLLILGSSACRLSDVDNSIVLGPGSGNYYTIRNSLVVGRNSVTADLSDGIDIRNNGDYLSNTIVVGENSYVGNTGDSSYSTIMGNSSVVNNALSNASDRSTVYGANNIVGSNVGDDVIAIGTDLGNAMLSSETALGKTILIGDGYAYNAMRMGLTSGGTTYGYGWNTVANPVRLTNTSTELAGKNTGRCFIGFKGPYTSNGGIFGHYKNPIVFFNSYINGGVAKSRIYSPLEIDGNLATSAGYFPISPSPSTSAINVDFCACKTAYINFGNNIPSTGFIISAGVGFGTEATIIITGSTLVSATNPLKIMGYMSSLDRRGPAGQYINFISKTNKITGTDGYIIIKMHCVPFWNPDPTVYAIMEAERFSSSVSATSNGTIFT